MADNNIDLNINVNGSSSAKQALDEAAAGLQGISDKHDAMAGRFQQRIQHMGLRLFADDALRANGLGAEARMGIGLLNSALMSGAEASGAGATALLGWVAAIGLAVGVIYKVVEAHKSHLDALEKTTKASESDLKTMDDTINKLQDQAKTVGFLTGAQTNLLQATMVYRNDLASSMIPTYKEMLAEIQKQINANTEHAMHMHILNGIVQEATGYWAIFMAVTKAWIANLPGVKSAVDEIKSAFDKWKGSITLTAEEQAKLNLLNDKLIKQQAEIGVAIVKTGDTDHRTREQILQDIDDYVHKSKTAEDTVTKDDTAQWQLRWQVAQQTLHKISGEMGTVGAAMILDGEKLSDGLKQIFDNILRDFISMCIQMIAEWAILETITMGNAGTMAEAKQYFSTGVVTHNATGTDQLVTQPKMFLAGEAGPEFVSISPAGNMANGGGSQGGGTSVGNVYVTVNGITDPRAIADQVGQAIISRIRGRGDLNFSRG